MVLCSVLCRAAWGQTGGLMADLKFVEKRHKFVHNGVPRFLRPVPASRTIRSACVALIQIRPITGETVYEWSQAIDEVNIYMCAALGPRRV